MLFCPLARHTYVSRPEVTEGSTCSDALSVAFLQCYPAEVFPTRFRASAHGMSAACGKAGAIISALAFNSLSKSVGTPVVLWSASLLFL